MVDGPADPDTAHVGEAHGAHDRSRSARHEGINVARNAAADAASGDLLAFLDDDVTVWPGWRAALERAAAEHPEAGCFGGPIHPRLEGPHAPHGCGRPQDAPVTALDLGAGRPRGRLRLGRELRRPPRRARRGRPVRSRHQLLRRRGGLAAPPARGRRHRPLRRAGRRRAPPHRRRRSAARARARRLPPRPRRPRLRRPQEHGAAASRTSSACSPARFWHVARHGCAAGLVPVAHTAGRSSAATSSSR